MSRLTHWTPIEYYETAAQAQARREDQIAREALGLPAREAIATVMRECSLTERHARALLDRMAAERGDP